MVYNVCLIGLGNIGLLYDINSNENNNIMTHAKAFHNHRKFSLSFGVDPSENKRSIFSNLYGYKSYESIDKVDLEENPDLIVISTPSEMHKNIINEILIKYRPKIILCEKPLGVNHSDAIDIVKICKEQEVILLVNYFRRVEPGFLEVKRLIKDNLIEAPYNIICHYSKGIYNSATHFIDCLINIQIFISLYKGWIT